jgi:general secretion pathway protein N
MLLLGQVAIQIENAEALTQTIKINGNWNQWRIHPSGVRLRAEQLALLGAPFNTLKLSGNLLMSWQELLVGLQDQHIEIIGIMQMDFKKIASALSPVKPLGEYQLKISCLRSYANVQLLTLHGPLQIQGQGMFNQGRLKFSGVAYADVGQEKQLSLLLNLLGQPKRDGNPNHIALEFK